MSYDIRLPVGSRQRGAYARLHVLISYPDLGCCSKRQALVHKEFSLSNFSPLSVFCGGVPTCPILAIAVQLRLLIKQIPGDFLEVFECAEETGVVQSCVQVGKHECQSESCNCLGIGNEVDNIVLAIGTIRDVAAVYGHEHRRTRREVK